jgi:hypothetical protein|tara:strand:+ start:95 stop:493 length:399 start_codon:yes stop_codon:yes gene_type:complete
MKKKKPNIKTIIRQIVREEVAMAINEVITELKQPTQSQPKSKKKVVEKKTYSKNSVLNDVLNETASADDWKTLGGGELTTERMNDVVGRNYGDMMSGTQQVPSSDPMSQFLNKDYSEVLEKSMEKSKMKHGR